MLRTTLHELGTRRPGLVPAIDPKYGSFTERGGLGLHQIFPPRGHVGGPGFRKRFLVQKAVAALKLGRLAEKSLRTSRRHYGCVDLNDLDALVDISGFAFTDQWGPRHTRDFAALSGHYRSRKKPVIMLPQAFGPFTHPEIKDSFRHILQNARLVFARDETSLAYAQECSPPPGVLQRAPDITLFYHPPASGAGPRPATPTVYIIPNIRMLDQGREEWGGAYKTILVEAAGDLLDRGIHVTLLIHDSTGQDMGLAREIQAELGAAKIGILQENDPLRLKQLIAGCLMVLGSRYHGLVSAFSQGVPAVALGWSHKYETLFEDFGCGRYVLRAGAPRGEMLDAMRELANDRTNAGVRQTIGERLKQMSARNREMWDLVVSALSGQSG